MCSVLHHSYLFPCSFVFFFAYSLIFVHNTYYLTIEFKF
ncbi:hypothetical protein DCAR_0313572 [Daucus carota subsp. sativus]|uniref:Uncharacterized protein n=1 Tax=Daucus carota subsp. sativus TaxID=79200 RepID=A0AAF0WR69_DAUCS|nr:hypothetical protein DCAR_0313572 [Daucus carota subsp. sativus]